MLVSSDWAVGFLLCWYSSVVRLFQRVRMIITWIYRLYIRFSVSVQLLVEKERPYSFLDRSQGILDLTSGPGVPQVVSYYCFAGTTSKLSFNVGSPASFMHILEAVSTSGLYPGTVFESQDRCDRYKL